MSRAFMVPPSLQNRHYANRQPVYTIGARAHEQDGLLVSPRLLTKRASTAPAKVAATAGVSLRQLARYEAGEQQPVLSAAISLADALGISLTQLAGQISYDLDLSGDWWAGWQTWKDGKPRVDTHTLEISQRGEVLQLLAEPRLRSPPRKADQALFRASVK
jgi:transcriptional regulator with XRE-family HTH domain